MSRTQSSAMTAHQALEVTSLTTCLEVFLSDGNVVRVTSHDADIVFGGNTFYADGGFDRTAISVTSQLDVDTVEIEGYLSDNGFTREMVSMGRLNGARYRLFAVNWQAPDDGQTRLRSGRLGEVFTGRSGRFRAELRSLSDFLSQVGGEVYSPTCRADLGDSRCKFPLLPPVLTRDASVAVGEFYRVPTGPGTTSEVYENRIYEVRTAGTTDSSLPTYDTTVGADTTDGTAVLRASQAWTRHASVTSVTSSKQFVLSVTDPRSVDGWFQDGLVTFESGPNAGISREIKAWQHPDTVELFLPFPASPEVGNVLRISVGCNKIPNTCSGKFVIAGSRDFNDGNILNYRGEFHLPGRDAVLSYPDTG